MAKSGFLTDKKVPVTITLSIIIIIGILYFTVGAQTRTEMEKNQTNGINSNVNSNGNINPVNSTINRNDNGKTNATVGILV